MDGATQARAAELAATVVFGVTLDDLRRPRSIPARLARGAAVAGAVDLHRTDGLTWNETADALGSVRGEPQCVSSLRNHRREFVSLRDADPPSAFSSALASLFETMMRHARLLCLSPSMAA